MSQRPTRILRNCRDAGRPFVAEPAESGADEPVAVAYERGRREGFDEGLAQAREEFERLADTLRGEAAESLRRLASLEEQRTVELETVLVELALEAASAIVRERIERGDPIAARVLKRAIASLPSSAVLRARVNPADLEATSAALDGEAARRTIELVADETISRGGCRVDSDCGTVDATLETATDQVRRAIGGERRS